MMGSKLISEDLWTRTKQEFPFGRLIRGQVANVFVWGFTVRVAWGANEIMEALVDAISYRLEGRIVQPGQFPAPGTTVEGRVVDHVKVNRRIKLFVGTESPLSDVDKLGSESSR